MAAPDFSSYPSNTDFSSVFDLNSKQVPSFLGLPSTVDSVQQQTGFFPNISIPGPLNLPNAGAPSFSSKLGNFLFGQTDSKTGNLTGGHGLDLLNLGLGGFQAYNSYQNLKLGQDALKFQKDAFSKQFESQRKLTNAELADRQLARINATTPGTLMSVEDYMKKYGV